MSDDEDSSDDGEENVFDDDQDDERAKTPSEMIPMDEAFQLLDDMVADWKTKLEAVVGEGLKKMRKNGKDKRAMAKYIPGQGNKMTDEAKAAILKVKSKLFCRPTASLNPVSFRNGCLNSRSRCPKPAVNLVCWPGKRRRRLRLRSWKSCCPRTWPWSREGSKIMLIKTRRRW